MWVFVLYEINYQMDQVPFHTVVIIKLTGKFFEVCHGDEGVQV